MNSNQPHPLEQPEGFILRGQEDVGKAPYNPQLYENSDMDLDPEVAEYKASESKFFGDKDPNLRIKTERPEHRMILFLRAQGKTPKEIAPIVGLGYQWVLQVCRQPWFKKRLIDTIAEAGQNGIDSFFSGEVLPSAMLLAEVRDDDAAKNSDRIAAANALLDRGLGKPTQHVKTERITSSEDAKKEVAELERELQILTAQEQSAGRS